MSFRDRVVRQSAPICLLLTVLGTGCIVPLGGHKPFKGKETGFIQIGVTTKDEIIDKLGQPRSTLLLERGSLLAYDASGVRKWFIAGGWGAGGGGETVRVSYRFVLRVSLSDEDVVTRTAITRIRSKKFFNSKDCPTMDLCYDRGHWMFLASRGMQRRTLESTVPDDLCAVFVVSDAKLFVTMDDGPGSMFLNEASFVHRLLEPGVHQFRRDPTEFEFECEAGHRYFLRVASDGSMQSVDANVGHDEIHTRRLLLTAQDS
jgi:hypothetical protein